jgi:hypothetical protein
MNPKSCEYAQDLSDRGIDHPSPSTFTHQISSQIWAIASYSLLLASAPLATIQPGHPSAVRHAPAFHEQQPSPIPEYSPAIALIRFSILQRNLSISFQHIIPPINTLLNVLFWGLLARSKD